MKPNGEQPKAPELKPESKPESKLKASEPKAGSKPNAPDPKDDLKTLPLPEVEKKLGSSPDGLSQAEAQKRLTQYGPNKIEEKKTNAFLKFLTYFWGPIPWMIEAAVILSGWSGTGWIFLSSSFFFVPMPWSDSGKNTRRATPSPHSGPNWRSRPR